MTTGLQIKQESGDATHVCPECGCVYICAGPCGYYRCSQPQRVRIEVDKTYPASPFIQEQTREERTDGET